MSGALAESARLRRCRNGRKELPHVRGRGGGWETYPTSKEWWFWGTGGPRGAVPHSRSEGAAVRRYPYPREGAVAALCWSSREEIPHVQGKRNPSKTVGVAREHQRADTLKPYSQKTSQSNHTGTTALSSSMKLSHARGHPRQAGHGGKV